MNWNAELIWKMRTELAYQWDLLEDDIPTVFESLCHVVKGLLLDLKAHLEGKLLKTLQSLLRAPLILRL